jgi:hypothetical protein
LEKLLTKEGHMPEDKYLLISRKGKRLGVAYASGRLGRGLCIGLNGRSEGPGRLQLSLRN